MSPAVRSLLEIIRARVMELLPFAEFGALLPVVQLYRLELKTLLRIIEIFGECQLGVSRHQSLQAGTRRIIEAAADVLAGWPANFHAMLQSLGERNADVAPSTDIRQQFAPFYSSVFKRTIADRDEDIDFIREAFLDFASNSWGERRIDARTLKRVKHQIRPMYVSRAELARRMGIDPRTIKRFSLLSPDALQRGPNDTYVHQSEPPDNTGENDGSVMRLRDAAAEIQIPVSVLRALKRNGEYKVTQRLPTQPGFRREDVIAFKNRLLGLVQKTSDSLKAINLTVLGEYMRRGPYSVVEKTSLIVGMLQREIPVLGNQDGSVKGLVLSQESASQCFIKLRGAGKSPAKVLS